MHNLLFCAHKLCMNYVTTTFLLVSSSVGSKQLLCFVHGQGQKRKQKHTGFITIDPYHSMSKKIFPVKPLIQREARRAKTMQIQSFYSPQTPKWPPSDKSVFPSINYGLVQVLFLRDAPLQKNCNYFYFVSLSLDLKRNQVFHIPDPK